MAVCYEAKERKIDARPRTPKNPHRIRWSTVRIFQGREQRRYMGIVRLVTNGHVGQAPTAASLAIPRREKMRMSVIMRNEVSEKYLPIYLDEFSFRFNNRDVLSMMDRVLTTCS